MCMSRALCCRCRNTELKWCMCEQRSAVYVVKQRSQKLHAWTKICCICCQTEISKVACVNKDLLHMLSNRDLKSCLREQRSAVYVVKQRSQKLHAWTKMCCICCQTEISNGACVNKDLLYMLSNRDLKSCMHEQRSAVYVVKQRSQKLLAWTKVCCICCQTEISKVACVNKDVLHILSNRDFKWCMCEQRSAVYVVKQRSQKLHAWTKICCICCQTEISKVACVNKGLLCRHSSYSDTLVTLLACRVQGCGRYKIKRLHVNRDVGGIKWSNCTWTEMWEVWFKASYPL
jgi:hypothetical protein